MVQKPRIVCAFALVSLGCAPPPSRADVAMTDASTDISDAIALDVSLDDAPDAALDATDDRPRPPPRLSMTVYASAPLRAALELWAPHTPETNVTVEVVAAPAASLDGPGAFALSAELGLSGCRECYRLTRRGRGIAVTADSPLGAQYGLSHAQELLGYRFFHPVRGHAPASLAVPAADPTVFDRTFAPEQSVRGLQLHTLHPIEAQAFWTPGAAQRAQARAITDWIVRNRGNFLRVAALNDISVRAEARDAWAAHLGPLLDEAHVRGLRTSVTFQLFSGSNLQRAFDLLPAADTPDARARIEARLRVLTAGMAWDELGLSFGEFSGVAPELFIARTNEVAEASRVVVPGSTLSATIHVGDEPSTRVDYMGRNQLYYMLVRYADPAIVPWVHTVMYYNLFDDAGGAYHHENFHEHRDYLFERLAARQPVVYEPESAYWVSFDNSVPTYLPVYLRSRWYDQREIRTRADAMSVARLDRQVTFTSGWEWGYWQNDAAVLRDGFALSDRFVAPMEQAFSVFGARGSATSTAIERLADEQYSALVTGRLAAYIAGQDVIVELGAQRGIVSQPRRPSLETLSMLPVSERQRLVTTVATPLEAHATRATAIATALETALGARENRWLDETRDGVELYAIRAQFAAALWGSALRHAIDGTDDGGITRAEALLQRARAIVARRHADLHWSSPETLINRWSNSTIYQYGYLYMAHRLCFWTRELAQARIAVRGSGSEPPGCFFP